MNNDRPSWYSQGSEPDYRFSLANERTFLAWIRTALAFLAVSLATRQVAQIYGLDPHWAIYSAMSAFVSILLSSLAYRKWKQCEIAMRLGRPLPHNQALAMLTLCMLLLGAALVIILFQ
ncbi:YidH family protein [Diaphorobacter caeni]|uniref:YidH family protein n=1 Tax=Diaphorobacter caeni TaxID=2784387 RepID=UPI00188F6395|nr:DUF202 domain-containing protein [Diaphorobacter caeni]MBF5007317.1 DUF202 domain-containing protein [Diaphorobacter caeni]